MKCHQKVDWLLIDYFKVSKPFTQFRRSAIGFRVSVFRSGWGAGVADKQSFSDTILLFF